MMWHICRFGHEVCDPLYNPDTGLCLKHTILSRSVDLIAPREEPMKVGEYPAIVTIDAP